MECGGVDEIQFFLLDARMRKRDHVRRVDFQKFQGTCGDIDAHICPRMVANDRQQRTVRFGSNLFDNAGCLRRRLIQMQTKYEIQHWSLLTTLYCVIWGMEKYLHFHHTPNIEKVEVVPR